jgi:hypothetical protein
MAKIKTKTKTRKNRCLKVDKTSCEVTDKLYEWYSAEFENLGWMILAQSKGMVDKITNYKSSLQHLKTSLEHKLKHLKDTDRKHDVNIMLHNVKILIDHVNKDF